MTDKVIVLSTCSSREEADRIARGLVEERLAACVNVVEGVSSVYRWKDAVQEDSEILLIIKSRRDLVARLNERLAAMHTYEVPEAIAIPVVDGSAAYLDWLERELTPQGNS